MKNPITFIKQRPWSLLLLYWVLHIIWFSIVNRTTMQGVNHVIYTPLDDKIPFIESFVVPYVLWYIYIFSLSIYFLIKNKTDYLRLTVSLITALFISMLVCTFYPSVIELRPSAGAMPDNIFSSMVRVIYSLDNPAAVFPSMHVVIAVLLFVGIIKSKTLGKNIPVVISGGILSVLICLSTVFIKQHSVLDLFAGVFLAVPVYILVYHVLFPAKKSAADTVNGYPV